MEAFQGVFKQQGKQVESMEQKIMKIIQIVDTNQSGCIDYTEFLVATINEDNILTE